MSNGQGKSESFKETVGESTHRVQEALQDLGRAGRDAATEIAGAARTSASRALSESKRRAIVARDDLSEYIQDNPMKSVLYAAAAGAVLGAYLARRR